MHSWLMGGTVGVDVPVEKLFTPEYRLEEGAAERLENTVEGLSRVILSTDAEPDFLFVRAQEREADSEGGELILVRYIQDMKKAYAMQIARSEYQERSVLRRRIDPVVVGTRAVNGLISELEKGRSLTALNTYLTRNIGQSLSPPFFLNLLELELKETVQYEVLDLKGVRVSGDIGLIWVKLEEHYTLKPGVRAEDLTFPSGFVHEWLFEVVGNVYPKVIQSAGAVTLVGEGGNVVRAAFPSIYSKWQDVGAWDQRPFREEMDLDAFVSEQAGRRMHNLFEQDPELKKEWDVSFVRCAFVNEYWKETSKDESVFEIDVTGKRFGEVPAGGAQDGALMQTVKLAQWILDGYDYDLVTWIRVHLADEKPYVISRSEIEHLIQ